MPVVFRPRRRTARILGTALLAAAVTAPTAASTGSATVAGTTTGTAATDAAHCGRWMNPKQRPSHRAAELLRAMSTAQKLDMLHQHDTDGSHYGAAGYVPGVAALCIPPLLLNDAGSGLGDGQSKVTAYPAAIAQAATWNPALQRKLGASLGGEAHRKGIDVLLGPDVNIARTPLNGRTSEAFGEDPYLAGRTGVAFIRGLQSRHVIATVKHYEANNQETNRGTVDAVVSQRTLTEIYHAPFAAAVRQAGVGSVMCSYNRVNGPYACQNKTLLRRDLERRMGFRGFVMSDWGATHSTVASARHGLDMEMGVFESTGDDEPRAAAGIDYYENYYTKPLADDVKSGRVSMSTINGMVRRILRSMFAVGLFDHPAAAEPAGYDANADTAGDRAIARRAAEAGSVLLKNTRATLPLAGPHKTLALIGDDASAGAQTVSQAGGSVHVAQPNIVTPLQGITARAAKAGDVVTYTDGSDPATAAAAAAAADVAVVDIGYVESEGQDLADLGYTTGACDLTCVTRPSNANALVAAVAAANPHTVVVLNTGGPAEMPWLSHVAAILETWYPGEENGDALAAVLFGDVDATGRLPITFPRSLAQLPAHTAKRYPGVHGKARYSEGLLVGYRWFDAKHEKPLFPFGFGLSYTHFRLSALRTLVTRHGATVSYRIRNTGRRTGSQVVQAYVSDPRASHEPPQQLKAYRRTTLRPGQHARVELHLNRRAFAHYVANRNAWRVTPGCYRLRIGDSSRHQTLRTRIAVGGGRCR